MSAENVSGMPVEGMGPDTGSASAPAPSRQVPVAEASSVQLSAGQPSSAQLSAAQLSDLQMPAVQVPATQLPATQLPATQLPPRVPAPPVGHLTGLPVSARRLWRRFLRRRTAATRLVRRRWRRSLQVRVVATTVLLGLVVVFAVGNFLLAQISSGLVDSRRKVADSESTVLFQQASQFIKNYQPNADPAQMASDLVAELQGPADSPLRLVFLLAPLHAKTPTPVQGRLSAGVTGRVDAGIIPTALREQVNADPAHQASTNIALPDTDAGTVGPTVPAIAVGTMIDLGPSAGGRYELYLVYRLDREVQILDLVRQTFLIGGALLVLLVGAVAFVVTRQVVAPVRQAASTAEELASGHLDRRMKVRGEDDLARLGRAFNEMAESLERQIHRLEELSRVQRQFVSDVSHELRTPLTTIRMAGEVMYESRASFEPTLARSAELLQAQLDRFELLLADLLEVSRFDAGAAVLEVEPVDVREVVTRVVDGLRPLAERRSCPELTHLPVVPCLAEIDPRRLERIVRNLVGNAIEHGEAKPVEIVVAADSLAVAVSVRDHGVGLREDELGLVFNRFWRADPARARSTGGTGLGLAIALEDAHLHDGWLDVWGRPGEGACFRLTLPRRAGIVLTSSPLPLIPDDAGPAWARPPWSDGGPSLRDVRLPIPATPASPVPPVPDAVTPFGVAANGSAGGDRGPA
jgi:two-component system sensor histidine kinase MtrB